MKIIRIIARLNVGGPARHVVWLTKGLDPPEFETTLIAGTVPPGEEDMSYFATENDVRPIYISELSRELSLKDGVSLFKVYRELRRQNPDIVHTHTAKAGTIGRIAALFYNILRRRSRRLKVVHTFHGHVFHSYYGTVKTRIFLTIERFLARFATDKIVVISEQQRREINGHFRVGRAEQFAVIPLGLDTDAFGGEVSVTLRDELGIGPETLLVGFTGRLTEIKNLHLLLDAASRLTDVADAPKMHFVLIGDGSLRYELEAKADELGLGETVTFLGHRADIEQLVSQFDIFALTSRNEGTPLSMIEAMAASVPVVSTAVGGINDLLGETVEVHDGFRVCRRGIAVDTFGPADFFAGLLHLAKNDDLRARLAEVSVQYIRATYSRSRLIDDIKSLYRGLMKM